MVGVAASVAVVAIGLSATAGPAGASPARRSAPAETGAAGVVLTSDIPYGEAPDETGLPETLRLDLYDPSAVAGVRPALVVVHGGGFAQGDKTDAVYVAMAQAFAEQGVVVAAVDYRLRPDTYPEFPVASVDAQHDVQAAVRWLRAHAGELRIDPERIAVSGHSAGAITALRVGAHPDDPGASGTPGESSMVAGVLAVSGFLAGDVGAASAPVRMLHGSADLLIPLNWADDTCKRWEAAGGACDLRVYEGATHDATGFFTPAAPEVAGFLACTVGGPVAYADVLAGSAAAQVVAWATGVGVLNGSVAGPLAPSGDVTRRQLAAWAWRWAGEVPDATGRTGGSAAIEWVIDSGILHSRRDGTFGRARVVSRAAAAMALWRLAGRPVAAPPSPTVPGLDPRAKYAPAVEWLVAHGIDALLVRGTFRPDAPLRRVQLLRSLRGLSADVVDGAAVPNAPACPAA